MSRGTSHIKVLMLLDNPFHSDLRVEKEAISLIQNGFAVTIFGISPKAEPGEETLANGIRVKRFRTALIHPMRKSYRQTIEPVLSAIEQESFDILHCHDFLTLIIGGIVKEKRPATFLTYDSHEYLRGYPYYREIPTLLNRLKGYINYRYLCKQEHVLSRKADCVVTTTEAIARQLQTDYALSELPLVVENIPTLQPQNDPANHLRNILDIPDETKIMVQSGNIYQSDSQLANLFEAVCKRDDLVLVLIGNRPRFYEVKDRFGQQALFKDCLHFIDYDSFKLYDMLASADFGFFYMHTERWASHRLTSPNRAMEYSLCGLPIVSVKQFTIDRLASAFDHVVYYSDTVEGSLDRALDEMIASLSERKSRAANIKNTLSWEQNIAPLIERYRSIKSQPDV